MIPVNISSDNPMLDTEYTEEEPLQLVFDLDDTLRWTQRDYGEGKGDAFRMMQRKAAPMWDERGIRSLYRRIDNERIADKAYAKDRVPGSLEQTYRAVADHMQAFFSEHLDDDAVEAYADAHVPDGLRQDFERLAADTESQFSDETVDHRANEAFYTGWQIVDKTPSQYAEDGFIGEEDDGDRDMRSMLAYVNERNDIEPHLLTAGDPDVQEAKIYGLELEDYFAEDNMHIVTRDKKDVLEEIKDAYGKDHVVMWGNSLTSDIEPSQELDIGHVYFHTADWEHERFENGVDTEHPKFMDHSTVDEGIDIIDVLTSSEQLE